MNPVRNTKSFDRRNKISNGVKITIKNFQKKIPVNPKRIKKAILKVLSLEGANPVRNTKSFDRRNKISNGTNKSGEITVCFTNDKKIKELNKRYLSRDTSTDVLAFDISFPSNSKYMVADIVVSSDTAIRQAKVFKTSPLNELYLYVIHGALHLLGYKDKTIKQRKVMDKKASFVLACLD